MTSNQTFAEAVGAFLHSYRQAHELTLDSVAKAGRKFGAKWSVSSVQGIEAGKSAPTIPMLLTLALALHDLTGEELTLTQLLGNAQTIAPPAYRGELAPTRTWIDQVLSGAPIRFKDVGDLHSGTEWQKEFLTKMSSSLERLSSELPSDFDFEALENVPDDEPTLAEERAAQRLGISPMSLRIWCHHLWGRSLDDEAAIRAEERSKRTGKPVTAQTRGSMTRQLLLELHLAGIGTLGIES